MPSFETGIRSEGIALLTADLIIQHGNTVHFKKLLAEGAASYDNQRTNQTSILLQEYKNNYPNNTKPQLEALIDQQFLCRNMIGKDLNQKALDSILNAKIAFDSILPKSISNVYQELGAPLSTLIAKERENVVINVLERGFVETFVKDRQEVIKLSQILVKSPYGTEAKNRIADELHRKELNRNRSRGRELEL